MIVCRHCKKQKLFMRVVNGMVSCDDCEAHMYINKELRDKKRSEDMEKHPSYLGSPQTQVAEEIRKQDVEEGER